MILYWSIYDVLLLVSGLIVLVILVAPVPRISVRTRAAAGAVGGGLVLLSIVLGSIPFFRYPWVVVVAPLVALLSAVAVIGKAVRGAHPAQVGEQGHVNTQRPRSPSTPVEPVRSESLRADLTAEDLMHLAVRDRSAWIDIARHPAAYQGLLDWLALHGDHAVRTAVQMRKLGAKES